MSKFGKWVVGSIVLVVILVLAFGTRTEKETSPIKIGFVGPLTGDASSLGLASRAAVEVAADEVNAAGGLNGQKVEVIYEDGKCSPLPATNAAQKLFNIDKVSGVIGGLCSGETSAFVKSAMETKKIVVSYCSSAPPLSNSGKFFFRTYPSDALQGRYAAEYLYNDLGARKVALIYHISDYGSGLKEVFINRFKELGGTVVAEEGVTADVRDYKTQLTKIKNTKPDYIYFALYPEGATVVVKQIKDLGITAKLFASETFGDTKFLANLPKAIDILFTESVANPTPDFAKKLLAKTGGDQVPTCAPQAYDAAQAVFAAIKQVGVSDPDKLSDAVRASDFQGVSGHIQFDQYGDVKNPAYRVRQIVNGSLVDLK
ncbi:MAG: penicillin-binding protein activator [Candidatus Taylorbacteria bacterium]|nr:penicillin-binding protein activator [Candidatus Taylorbacteria bacterium]